MVRIQALARAPRCVLGQDSLITLPVPLFIQVYLEMGTNKFTAGGNQGTKKFRSDSPGLVDFLAGLVEFILHLPNGQVKDFWAIFL